MIKKLYENVMVVCHPDDETFWGGETLSSDKNWFVVCITNGNNLTRRKKFEKAMDLFNVKRQIFDFPDRPNEKLDKNEIKKISDILKNIINNENIKKVATHNPNGEYGHPFHRFISKLVTSLILDKKKLYYFDFKTTKKEFTKNKKEALKIYLGDKLKKIHTKNSTKSFFDKFLTIKIFFSIIFDRLIETKGKYFLNLFLKIFTMNKLVKNLKLVKQNIDNETESYESIYYLSQFENLVKYSDFKKSETPRNFIDVYISRREVYEKYKDRKFIITEFLPSCNGKTLGVGCHAYNKNDCYCLPDPNNYETIDLNEKWSQYGSKYKHTTIDFLDFNPGYKFDNILLFGVLDIYPRDGDTDRYSLYKKEDNAIMKMDSLLNKKGKVLLGPDLNYLSSNETKKEKINYWKNFSKTNQILSEKYININQFSSPNNFVIVLQKK